MNGIRTLCGLEKALKKAKDDEEKVVSLLDENATLLGQDGGAELMSWAIKRHRVDVVKALAQRGVNLEASHTDGESLTPLQRAVRWGDGGSVRVLLNQGADAANKGVDSRTPLFVALQFHRVGVAKILAEHMNGQGMEERGWSERTALADAAYRGQGDIATVLLHHGADPRVRDEDDRTPLMLAAHYGVEGALGVVQALLQHLQRQDLDVATRGDYARTALHHACSPEGYHNQAFRPRIVETLLMAGANPTIKDEEGRTPRELAEEHRDWQMRAELVAVFEVSPS
jgi:ankyrin repeat protein